MSPFQSNAIPLSVICIFFFDCFKDFSLFLWGCGVLLQCIWYTFVFIYVAGCVFSSCIIWVFYQLQKIYSHYLFKSLFAVLFILSFEESNGMFQTLIIASCCLLNFLTPHFISLNFLYMFILYFMSDELVIVYAVQHSWWFIFMCVLLSLIMTPSSLFYYSENLGA